MIKQFGYIFLFVILVIVNLIVGTNLIANFGLGIDSVVIAYFSKLLWDGDITALVATFLTAILFLPFFWYLLWYAVIGVHTVSADVATNWLSDYVIQNFVLTLPSTIVGGMGAWIIEVLDDI